MANYQFKPLDRVQTNKMHPVDPFRQVMPKRHLGESGISVGEIGMGSAALGRLGLSAIPDDEALYFLGSALDMEASFFDCAPTYGGGRAERLIGQAAKGRRHEIAICTKAGYFEDGHFDFSAAAIRSSLEASLQRLQTGFVDVLLLHNPPLDTLNQANVAFVELEKLKSEGKIRAYGASVSGSVQIKALVEKTNSQVAEFPFNLLDQEAAAAFDAAAKKRVGLVACSPLDGGRLAGLSSHDPSVRALELAAPAGSSLSQVSLQFVLSYGAISCAVPGASDWHQVIGNVTSCQRRISASEIAALKAAAK
jgi:aryl-alcohol dehydrogenase-like predicted oxidoreductase